MVIGDCKCRVSFFTLSVPTFPLIGRWWWRIIGFGLYHHWGLPCCICCCRRWLLHQRFSGPCSWSCISSRAPTSRHWRIQGTFLARKEPLYTTTASQGLARVARYHFFYCNWWSFRHWNIASFYLRFPSLFLHYHHCLLLHFLINGNPSCQIDLEIERNFWMVVCWRGGTEFRKRDEISCWR